MKTHIGIALLLAGALGVAGGASAAETIEPENLQVRSITVPYDASQIRDPRSAEVLFFRIRQAAAEVCNIASHPRGYELWYEHACESEAVADAVDDANEPALDQFYTDVTGSALPR